MFKREEVLFALAARTVGSSPYTSAARNAGSIMEGLLYINVTDVGTNGTVDFTIRSYASDADKVAGNPHTVDTVPQITTTGRQDVIAITNLGAIYDILATVGTDTVIFEVKVVERVEQ